MAYNYVARSIRIQFDSDALKICSAAAANPEVVDSHCDYEEQFYSISELNRRKIKKELAQYLLQEVYIQSQYIHYFQQLPYFKFPIECEVPQAGEAVQIQCFTSYKLSLTATILGCQSQRTTDVDAIVIGSIQQVQKPSGELIQPCDIVVSSSKNVSSIQCLIHYKHRMKGLSNADLTFINCLKLKLKLERIPQFIIHKIKSYIKQSPCYIQNVGEGMSVQIQILKHLTKRNIKKNDIYVLGKSSQLTIMLTASSFKEMCQDQHGDLINNNTLYISLLQQLLNSNKIFQVPAELSYALICENPQDLIEEDEFLSEQLKEVLELPVLKFLIGQTEYYILGQPAMFTTIGTIKSNDIVIKGLSISEKQTYIGYNSGWFIGDGPTTCDCQSNYGTWRVMRKNESSDLHHEQQFQVGDQRFRFMELYNNFVLQQH